MDACGIQRGTNKFVYAWRRDCHSPSFRVRDRRRLTDVLPTAERADGDIVTATLHMDDIFGAGNIALYRPTFSASGGAQTEGHMRALRRRRTNSAQLVSLWSPAVSCRHTGSAVVSSISTRLQALWPNFEFSVKLVDEHGR